MASASVAGMPKRGAKTIPNNTSTGAAGDTDTGKGGQYDYEHPGIVFEEGAPLVNQADPVGRIRVALP